MAIYQSTYNKNIRYREALLDMVSELDYSMNCILLKICGIAMAGELKEWSDSVPDDEEYDIDIEVFEACEDFNIKSCIELIYKTEDKFESLLNINRITIDEILAFRKKKFDDMCSNEISENEKNDDCNEDESEENQPNELPF